MPEIIQDWLGTRLGVVLDLSPPKFGRNTKDGVLLARLLYGYGVIPVHVLEKVKETKNYYGCYENLNVLKPWLEHIGVVHDDAALQSVARGEGSSAISLFYSVYLNLETKDRLYYISAQKERRFSVNNCKRDVRVEWVPELSLRSDAGDGPHERPSPFLDKQDLIEWHRQKCKDVVEKIKKVKMKFSKRTKRKQPKLGPVVSKHSSSRPIDRCALEAENARETIASFECKHLKKSPNLKYSELVELNDAFQEQICFAGPSSSEARNIVTNIKTRKRSEIYARNFHENMQNMVLDEHWKQIVDKQSDSFEDKICETFLKQSQYEKQMASRLCQVRHQKKVFAENRKLVENLKMEQSCKEHDDLVAEKEEMKDVHLREESREAERLAELHKRVYNERIRARREFLINECGNIIASIVDIAVRVSEIRELSSCQVPKALMKDWKELFFRDLPIFDAIGNYEELLVNVGEPCLLEEDTECADDALYVDSNYENLKNRERQKQTVLNDTDFDDYMNLLGPWMVQLLFPDGPETEVPQTVLGYVVHKLLEVKYPIPNQPHRVPIKPMTPKAVVLDLETEGAKMLVDLMETRNVLVVQVNDAINFVLSAYKEELSVVRDIDLTFRKLSDKALQDKSIGEKDKEAKKKITLLKKEEPAGPLPGTESSLLDKETQTPRMIPDEDPPLTPNAAIGKLAFEALGAGDPVPDVIIVAAIVAYVGSKQEDYDGWVLLNYPRLYVQASELECRLTGYRLLPLDEDVNTLEDVEGFTFREPCVDPFTRDDFTQNRLSKLVTKPNFEETLPDDPRAYFDLFIKMKKTSNGSAIDSADSSMFLPVEEFYCRQRALRVQEYSSISFQTVKNIGKMILSDVPGDPEARTLTPKTSVEVFGSVINDLNDKWDPGKKKIAPKANNKPVEEVVKKNPSKDTTAEPQDQAVRKTVEGSRNRTGDGQVPASKPGDRDWEWATGVQSDVLLRALAGLWENMETIYIEDIKDVFFCLRCHRANVLSYCAFIRKSIRNVMRQPDDKQKVLGDFQQMFNDIDLDLRPDIDIKCELHVRISELEEALLGIADDRKANSLKDVAKITQDGWVADEMANLVNHFLSIVQLEADRSTSTCQILMDYYSSLQQKTPEDRVVGKVTVSKLQIKDRKYSILSSSSSSPTKTASGQINTPKNSEIRRSTHRSVMEQGSRSTYERTSKTRALTERRRKTSDASFLTGASEVITEILGNLSWPADGVTPFHNFFQDSIQLVRNEITAVLESYITDVRKGVDKTVGKNVKRTSDAPATVAGGAEASLEWETALENELSRFLFRMKLILSRGTFDMNEFLATMLNTLFVLTEDINEMYLKEVQSIYECCKVFRCCVEEEIPVRLQLVLKEDEFFVEEDVVLVSKDPAQDVLREDKERKVRFSVDQLSLLCEKLSRVAPEGEIIKRSLVFIMEDLRALNPEIRTCNCFPVAWRLLDPEDLVDLIDDVYQDLEIVPWKDFIIYALEVSAPSEEQVLTMRRLFRRRDPQMTELVSREDYDQIEFWFENPVVDDETVLERVKKTRDLLFRMYQVNETQVNYSALLLAFCKDENPIYGFTKALALVMGKRISTNEFANDEYLFAHGEDGPMEEDEDPYEHHRRSLAVKPCLVESSHSSARCYPKDRMVQCACGQPDKSTTTEEELSGSWRANEAEEPGEAPSFFYSDREQFGEESVILRVPYAILSALFKASFPSLSQLSVLLDCRQTFEDTLNAIYDSLESHDSHVEVYKLLRHDFVSRLIQSTNKFRFIKLRQILMSRLKAKNMSSRSFCSLFNVHCDFSP